MLPALAALTAALTAATLEVPAGADLAAALARARPGDLIRLGPGEHRGALGRARGPVQLAGAGAGVTVVLAPEGEDALVVDAGGKVSLSGLTLVAGPARAAVKMLGGELAAQDVVLLGGAAGLYADGGQLSARELEAHGEWGILQRRGTVRLEGAVVRGARAGVAQLGGDLRLERAAVTGPSTEAGISCSGGTAQFDLVTVRAPGPSGLAVTGAARVEAHGLTVAGATGEQGFLGDCVQLRRGALTLSGARLARCGGAAVEAFGGQIALRGVDASGGEAGCLAFLERAAGDLSGNRCVGRGPAIAAAGGAQVAARMNRWETDPVLWVQCGSGARVRLGPGETVSEPCRGTGKPGQPLDKAPHP